MKLKLFSIAFLFLGLFSFAQTADEIIQKHFEVTGGAKAWSNLHSIQIDAQFVLGVEETYRIKIYHQRPNLFRQVFIENGKEVLGEGYDGENGYTYNRQTGKNVVKKDYKPVPFETEILNYASKGFKATYEGKEEVNGKSFLKVKLVKFKNEIIYYFDPKTYYLHHEFNNDEFISYSDFRTVDGLLFAFSNVYKPKGGAEYKLNFTEVKVNPSLSRKLFKFKN